MSPTTYFIVAVMIIFALIIFFTSAKTGKTVRSLLLTAVSGIGSLFAVNIASALTGASLSVNYITLLISAIGGIPGTVALLLSGIVLS